MRLSSASGSPVDYFLQTVEEEALIKNNNTCKDFLIEAMKYHLLPLDQRLLIKNPRTKPRTPVSLPKVSPSPVNAADGTVFWASGLPLLPPSLSSPMVTLLGGIYDLSDGVYWFLLNLLVPLSFRVFLFKEFPVTSGVTREF